MPDGERTDPYLPTQELPPPADAVVCPECGESVPAGRYAAHLREAHRLYQYRGARRSAADIVQTLLDAVVSARPDPEAWQTLRDLAWEEHGGRDDYFLTELLGRSLARLEGGRRDAVVEALAPVIAGRGAGTLVATLASDAEPAARHLALLALGHLTPPLDPVLVQPLRALLLDRRLPAEAQLDAMAAALRAFGDGPLTAELLQKLTSGLGKRRSIERLRLLEQRAGKSPAIDALCAQLEDRLRMTCPRCGTELRRPEMIRHLWEEHRLVLEGRRVRDPWSLIEDWVEASRSRDDPELLERCRVLGQRLDPEGGLLRVHRLMMARGVGDRGARRHLLHDASRRHAACCPWCYNPVPVPREVPPLVLNQRRGRLTGGGYGLEISERGLRPRLDVWTPYRRLYRGPEPGRRWTRAAASLVFVGPWVVAALAWAVAGPAPLRPVGALLLAALVMELLLRAAWRWRMPPAARRVREHAWAVLAPRLHADGFNLEDSAFLAGLARQGSDPGRAGLLPELLRKTESAVRAGAGPPGHLAALRRLAVEGAAAAGEDPVPLVAAQLDRCFRGRLPLAFAEQLLDDWQADWWTRGNLARLRILLCDRAFEAGFEVRNLLDAGQNAPSLGAVLHSDEPEGLSALRLLWSLRPSRPWDRCGPSVTAFELAADPGRARLLGAHPDLLLWQEEPGWVVAADGGTGKMGAAQVLLCVDGVWLQEVLFRGPPRVVEVISKSLGHELVMGEHHFRSPGELDSLARRMERWFRYAFHEFFPAVAGVRDWQSPDRATILRAWGAVPCPECRRFLLARVGEVGIALDEAAPAER